MKILLKGTLAGGVVAFIWSMISWSALPWHFDVLHAVPNEAEVARTLKSDTPQAGVYVIPDPSKPDMEEFHRKLSDGPYAYMLIRPGGVSPNMPLMILKGILLHLVIAFMLTWLVTKAPGLGFLQRVGLVVVAVLTGTFFAHLGYLNWWFFPLDYTLIYIVDVAIGWALAGAAIAKLTPSLTA